MALFSLLAEVLFVGHSLVGPLLPGMVETGMAAMAAPVPVQAQLINGAPLKWNWDHAPEAEGVDGRAEIGRGLVSELILTEAQPIADHLQWSASAAQVEAWAAAATQHNPDARVWLYESWPAFGAGPAAVAEWRAQIRADLPLWQQAAGDQARIMPAGQAMAALSEAIEAGVVPEIGSIRELFSDDIHPNGKGLYLVAMVQIAGLTGRSPQGLSEQLFRIWPDRAAVMTKAQAAAFQRIAWQTVQDFEAAAAAPAVSPPPSPEPPSPEPPAAAAQPPTEASAGPQDAAKPAGGLATVKGSKADPALTPISNPNLAFGLAGVSDWAVQRPFLDLMKTARPWIGHLPGQWGGWGEAELRQAGALDAAGWPRQIPEGLTGLATLILTDLPAEAGGLAGRYLLIYRGKGELRLEGRVSDVTEAPGELRFSYTPGPGSVMLTLLDTDAADPLRQIQVVREDRAGLLASGAIFNPDWLARLQGIRMFRAMDWMATNDATLARAKDRPKLGDYSWARQGVPVEVIFALANQLQAEPWITLPHLAEDALLHEIGAIAARDLDPGLRLWAEYSNEVWNWQFAQAAWAEAAAKRRWGGQHGWVQFYALRAAEAMQVLAAELPPARLVRVISTQTGWLGLEEQILAAPQVLAEGRPAPAKSFDAYAVSGYFAGGLGSDDKRSALKSWLQDSRKAAETAAQAAGLTGAAAAAYVQAHRYDLALVQATAELRDGSTTGLGEDSLAWLSQSVFPHHAAVAKRYGLQLVMYEGGSHVVANGAGVDDEELTDFFTYLNYTPQMGALYLDLLASWKRVSDAPFNAFVDVAVPGKWGSWGALRHLRDDNPRWQALAKGCTAC